jgi:hypothetical protein
LRRLQLRGKALQRIRLASYDIDDIFRQHARKSVDIEDDGIHAKGDWVKEIQQQKNNDYLFKDFKFEEPRLIRVGPDAAVIFGKETWPATDRANQLKLACTPPHCMSAV